MRRAKILPILATATLCSAAAAPSSDFEFGSQGVCNDHMASRKDKLTLRRLRDGTVQARVVFNYSCLWEGDQAPRVDYLTDRVQLRADWGCDEIAVDLLCKQELTFRLTRAVARGTRIHFGFGSEEPHLSAIAP
jgi:hypothetical protein